MTPYEIPLSPNAQQFYIALGGVQYSITVRWCPPAGVWVMDLGLGDDTVLVTAIPLVTGVDLLKQYAYLGVAGSLYVQSDANLYATPDFTNLGVTGHLYFITP